MIRKKLVMLLLCIMALAMVGACDQGSGVVSSDDEQVETDGSAEDSTTTDEASEDTATADEADEADGTADTGDTESAGVASIVLAGDSISLDGFGVTISGSTATITSAGNYSISGNLADGSIIVNTEDEGTVTLIFNGIDISCSTSSPVYVLSAESAVIVLADGTENYVVDGDSYVFEDPDEDEPDAAIFSKSDLTVSGSGLLSVYANYNDGIKSKDGLFITGGAITVSSVDDGIMGKDFISIEGGTVTVDAQGDGLKSTNDEDTDKGYVTISGGVIAVVAGADGIQAETEVMISGGDISLTSGGGSTASFSEDDSAKGIKASVDITVDDGVIAINSADDAIHSNGSIAINGGTFDITSGDDGIHADSEVVINSGTISITKSYEGIEGSVISVNGGDIHVASSDDGLNVAGGNDGSSITGRPGQNTFTSSGSSWLYINGGYIVVTSGGDGLDANGSIAMTDGVVIINGPSDNGNGAIDYDSSFSMSGGFLVAAGSSGMAMAPDQSSTQPSVLVNFRSSRQAGILVHIQTSGGDSLLSFAPAKTYQSIVFSSPELTSGSSCDIYYGGSSTGTATDGLYEGGVYTPGTHYSTVTVTGSVTTVN